MVDQNSVRNPQSEDADRYPLWDSEGESVEKQLEYRPHEAARSAGTDDASEAQRAGRYTTRARHD